MTAETLDTPAVASPTATPPHPLREFWGYFSANHGAVAGLVGDRRGRAGGHLGGCHRASLALSHRHDGRAQAAVLAGGRLADLSARDRSDRPRHPLAPYLRLSPVVDDRHRSRVDLDRSRHRSGTRRGLRARHDRDLHHAADGHHPDAAEPAARDRHRGGARPRPHELDARGGARDPAALRATGARRCHHRNLQGLRDGRARERSRHRSG